MHTITRTRDGARIYSPLLLFLYDFLIMRVLTPYVWKCPAYHYSDLYRRHMSHNHADIGVGTGYMLDRCQHAPHEQRIALFDLQRNCLEYTAQRIARFAPEIYQCDAIQPIITGARRFDSIALGGILHCIPGGFRKKGRVFDNIAPLLNAGATVFGYTILNRGVRKTILSRLTYFMLNQLKVINGIDDSAEQLSEELHQRFQCVEMRLIGCVAVFVARTPNPSN